MIERSTGSFVDLFDLLYAPLLGVRGSTFRRAFEVLEARQLPSYRIVETGTAHETNGYGLPREFSVQGNSTLLFDAFTAVRGGAVWSVDVSEAHCAQARRWVSRRVNVVCSDSRAFLSRLEELAPGATPVDCLYLDSFDIDWKDPHPSALHHRQELRAALRHLAPGCVVFVDDTPGRKGKGGYLVEVMERLGAQVLFESYQMGWVLPESPLPGLRWAPDDPEEAAAAARFDRPRRFRYVRVGLDERVLELLPSGAVGLGNDRCEQRWMVERSPEGKMELLLAGEGQITCRLAGCGDGVWRGRWCIHERMPVELAPL
ncbi:MAG TPA: class I SAM-dependent methyltransferase [Myxococcaceae bacterium]|jgi:hypothetical protein